MLVIVFEVDLSCCLDELSTLHNGYAREQKFDNLNYWSILDKDILLIFEVLIHENGNKCLIFTVLPLKMWYQVP